MQTPIRDRGAGSPSEVFATFLKLGLTSFGGPVAHLGYFRQEIVLRRRWLSEAEYADLVALCQFLPGPASSQVGVALGLQRAGWLGALAAFVAFTLPSAALLFAFALGAAQLGGDLGQGALAGLKIVAVAIVAQAVWGMARALCPDGPRAAIALGAVAMLAFLPGALGMLGAIGLGAVAGLALGQGARRRAQGRGPARKAALCRAALVWGH
jgi:chromate transporter